MNNPLFLRMKFWSVLLSTHNWSNNRWMPTNPKGIGAMGNANSLVKGFLTWSLCLFPTTITISLRAPPFISRKYIYICVWVCVYLYICLHEIMSLYMCFCVFLYVYIHILSCSKLSTSLLTKNYFCFLFFLNFP